MINLENGFYVKSDGTQFMLCTIKESTKKDTNEKSSREEDMELKDVLKAIKEFKEEIKSYL